MVDTSVDLATHYLDASTRICTLAREEADRLATTAVPSCPGWSAQDVIAHVSGVVEDALSGKLRGIPTDEQNAEQVESRRGRTVEDLLVPWIEQAPAFATIIAELRVWPAVFDVLTHEQDLRGALDRPGARDTEALLDGLDAVVPRLAVPEPLTISTGTRGYCCGPVDGDPVGLRVSDFELFRIVFGRRSRAQLLALDWEGHPAPVVDHLYVFGPAAHAIIE